MRTLMDFVPLVATLVVTVVALRSANWFLLGRHKELAGEKKFTRQLIMLALSLLGIVAVALSLPLVESTRNQLIAFIGLVVSGIFAFSSTTLFANLMAGVMMRITQPFRAGDFVRVKEFFGRVSERGLLDTEIQTENRELIAVPNTFLIANPVTVVRSSGTIVSASLSLGYELNHSRIEPLLVKAAADAGLEDPYVHVTELGNYAVSYRVNGLLRDVKSVLTARSQLCKSVLDTLHREDIEIVSPSFMNQRPLKEGQRFIPVPSARSGPAETRQAEEIVFDKAEAAEKRELERIRLTEEIQRLEASLKEAAEELRERIALRIDANRKALDALEEPKGPASSEHPEDSK